MIVGVLNHAYVAQQALGRQKAGLFVENGAEELVGGAKALHQHVGLAVVDHLHCLRDSLELHGVVNYGEFGDIQAAG